MLAADVRFGDAPAWVAIAISLGAITLSLRQHFQARATARSKQARAVSFYAHPTLTAELTTAAASRPFGDPPQWLAVAKLDNRADAALHDVVLLAKGTGLEDTRIELFTVEPHTRLVKSFSVASLVEGGGGPPSVTVDVYFTDSVGVRWRRGSNASPVQVAPGSPPWPDIRGI